ncbi:hypothetical protein [Amycolatopsis samaneae]|uniref:Uncharacterized protein n=1 Tax=Amycolatopsis samaneae TaxID=664691 RepID=A0ABW5G8H6_9PSEU
MNEDTLGDTVENQNIASDNAHVDQQIGVQHVDSVFHHATIYNITEGDTAERKHDVALAYLTGGVPRRAEAIFHELVFDGDQSTERIYYYVLAVLSERRFGDLTADLASNVHNAGKLCASLREDEWSRAHHVVRSLVELVRSHKGDRAFTAVTAFGGLPADRQDEISRHLSLLVSGAIEEQLEVERKHKVSTERFSRDREKRAWKFFEPDPVLPVRYQPRTSFTDIGDLRSAIIGGTVALPAFAGLFFGALDLPLWGGLAVLVAGCAVMVRYGIEHIGHMLYLAFRRDAERPADEPSVLTQADKLIERCFRDACPPGAQGWLQYAAGYRRLLQRRFNDQLRHDQNYSQTVKRLKWLFDWHARRVAQQWPAHPSQLRPEPAAPEGARAWRAVGVVLAVAGVVLLAAAHHWLVVPLAVGGHFVLLAVVKFFAARRTTQLLLDDADARFDEEMAEYHRWRDELSDRPDDGDMAHWLALDKAHLKAEAMRGGRIADRELVSYVVLNERTPWARRGAVSHGPPRYEAYLVTVILLTRHGAQSSRVYLDFVTGDVKNEDRNMFGYDRIASASLKVREKTFRRGLDQSERKVRNREFRLRLLDGSEILTISQRADVESDTEVDDETEQEQLAAVTSGIDAAIPILEAVAHRGRSWIDVENDRRTTWLRNWPD